MKTFSLAFVLCVGAFAGLGFAYPLTENPEWREGISSRLALIEMVLFAPGKQDDQEPPAPEPEPKPEPEPEPKPEPTAEPFFRAPELVEADQADGFALIVVETNLPDDPTTTADDVIVKARKTLTERVRVFEIKQQHPDGLTNASVRTWVLSTATPGDYLVEFNLPIRRAPETLVSISGTAPKPEPEDEEKEEPKPDPKPEPKPTGQVGGVVVVEQMQILNEASRNIRMSETWRRLSQTKELVEKASWYDVDDPNASEFKQEAEGVGLPAILLFDKGGDFIRAEPLPKTEAKLLELVK